MLEIKGLSAQLGEKNILRNVDLEIDKGELHLLMGPNGAGKSTLLTSLLDTENIETTGQILFDGKDISSLDTSDRAKKGLFVGFQHPTEIPGVHLVEFLRTAYNLQHPDDRYDPWSFVEIFDALADKVGLPSDFSERNLNEGFSGGEKKRSELLQMMLLRPKYAFLDEIDSGLDISSLTKIFDLVRDFAKKEECGVTIITHNPNILEYVKPDKVHLMKKGTIVESSGEKLVNKILDEGY